MNVATETNHSATATDLSDREDRSLELIGMYAAGYISARTQENTSFAVSDETGCLCAPEQTVESKPRPKDEHESAFTCVRNRPREGS